MTRIWLIGGTQESRLLAQGLVAAGCAAIITVTTDGARSLYPSSPLLSIQVGALAPDTLPAFLEHHAVRAILDASHPFAVQVSEMAIAAAHRHHIPYLRFERPEVHHPQDSQPDSQPANTQHLSVLSVQTLVEGTLLTHQRVLFTLGYRLLPLFESWQDKATLFARILPSQTALDAALKAGFTGDRLIALRPPISPALERALWQQWQISMVVTKASGTAGGEDTKRHLAEELGVRLITLTRPLVEYPAQTSRVEGAIAWCLKVISP